MKKQSDIGDVEDTTPPTAEEVKTVRAQKKKNPHIVVSEDEEPEDKAQNLDLRSFLNKRKRSNEPVDEVSRKTEKKIKESRREDDQSCVCCSAVGHTLKNCKVNASFKTFVPIIQFVNVRYFCKLRNFA